MDLENLNQTEKKEISQEGIKNTENSEKKQISVWKGGKFIKGQSGNPKGKPPGIKNKKTLEKKLIEQEFRDRILMNVHDLLSAQMNLAKGAMYLYRIDEVGSGKHKHRVHVLVENPEEIKQVLDECEGTGVVDEKYYYIATKEPKNEALDSLFNRVFGKPKESFDLSSGGQPLGIVFLPMRKKDEAKQLNPPENNPIELPNRS